MEDNNYNNYDNDAFILASLPSARIKRTQENSFEFFNSTKMSPFSMMSMMMTMLMMMMMMTMMMVMMMMMMMSSIVVLYCRSQRSS